MLEILLFASISLASPAAVEGVARDRDGKIVYREKHETAFSDGKPKSARTDYVGPGGETIGELVSDFGDGVAASDYSFVDRRDGSSHGIDVDGDSYVLWTKTKDGPRKEKRFAKNSFPKDAWVVGGQGLHYELVSRLGSMTEKTRIPVKYLIPGRLDYFSFTLSVEKIEGDLVHFKLVADSLFIRFFASSMSFSYSRKDRRLAGYSGLSNIPDPDGGLVHVDIAYADGSRAKE